ncbi:PHD and RING finger domain-containing protein 1 isoform X2 [Cololabis saira]|uniref:PHD and RING finger domain-containing protein 1 isoform X2 n=1 Tax=Cololabis saira TaxID=129043 RepID=UPI002AD44AE0|nr:PHD and RING finger domain-containing protein 1 isoform X2 [Cololabis saira]
MDEDNSQDELINCSTSHRKGKRAALWNISDDSDDVDEELGEEQSDSGEDDDDDEEEEENDDDDEEEEEEEEGDDDDEEEDAKTEDGAFGGTSADVLEMSSDEDADKCPICLNSFNSQPVATPENCEHYFCFDCILEWAKNVNSCPVDRSAFNNIYLRKCYGGKVKKMITVQKPVKADQEEIIDVDLDETSCEVCGGTDREDRLLLCDGCDAGYHMECLTPPLDSVPVEEWFCPECVANNRHSRGSAEELSDTESIPFPARPATSRSQPRAAGPTRAIARTQQSERVRANVNRHRISQLAPTYLIQSSWLDDTINAVVAGLNTAVYVRDVTPRAPSTRRRRRGTRRKVNSKTSSAKGKNGRSATTGVKRRRRRVRRTKSRKKLTGKTTRTPRSRIANNLGIVNNKKSSSLPTVYQPVEHTLSSMRADIGAASLSIYGDPFDLDPFVDREEEPEARAVSLLEAKRRGISRSALRSHQPVARPVSANLSRRGVGIPQTGAVVEAAPVPDLLGSILSGQSMLLMDSSDVVINRDGSLKAAKPMMPSTVTPCIGKSNSSEDADTLINPGVSPHLEDIPLSHHYNGNLPGPSHTSVNRLLNHNSPHVHSPISNHTHSDFPPRVNPSFQSAHPNRPTPPPCQRGTNGIREPRESPISSVQTVQDSNFKSKEMGQSQSQPKKAATKPMWVDVSVLPRIPKIKRESSTNSNDASSHGGSYGSNTSVASSSSNRRNGSNSRSSSSGSSGPDVSITSLSGDKGRQQSVDQQKGQANGDAQRHRPDGTSSTSAFSNSFSSSSSSGTPPSQPQHASSSSSSSVSFRINSSGNSWHARRLNIASSSTTSTTRGTVQEHWGKKEDDTKKKQLGKDKKKLLSSRVPGSKEQESNIYDPFNPTLSDSSSSDDEAKSTTWGNRPQRAADQRNEPSLKKKGASRLSKQDLVLVKTETQEMEVSQEQAGSSQSTESQEVRVSGDSVKVEQESRLGDETTAFLGRKIKQEPKLEDTKESESSRLDDQTTAFLGTKIKQEPKLEDTKESESCDSTNYLSSELTETTAPAHHSLDRLKKERDTQEGDPGQCAGTPNRSPLNHRVDSSAPGSANSNKKQKEEAKSYSTPCSKSPTTDLDLKKQASKNLKEQQSSSSETERRRREEPHGSGQGNKKKERDRDRSPKRAGSKERRRAHSSSDSSQPKSPDRTHRKRRSRSKESSRRRRSRSRSSSSSREHSRRKKQKPRSSERNYHSERDYERRRVSKDKKRGRSRSRSRSKSRSRSRSRSRSKDRKRAVSRSRSRSRERRKDDNRQQQHHSSMSSRSKVESRPKDKRRHKSRSSSRERKQQPRSSRNTPKASGACDSSSKDANRIQGRKKERDTTERNIEKAECAKTDKQELPSCSFAHPIKKEERVLAAESQESEMTKEVKHEKEVGQEYQSCHETSEDSSVVKTIKEETDTPSLASKNIDDVIKQPIKTESCESTIVKTEPESSKLGPLLGINLLSTLTTPVTADTLPDAVSQSPPVSVDSCKQEDTVGVPVPAKQEPSDSEEDFNVDVMLDNLDYVKSEPTVESGAAVKKEKEVEDSKDEGGLVSSVVGTKSKTQVKRVTWNIQEPEGPQPEKAASKVALYKLKLKQEGARRPSSAAHTSSQGMTGDVRESSKKGTAGLLSAGSGSEVSHSGQEEAEEGDLSKKDKQYLKKLHMQERAVEEVKLAIKPFYQKRDITKDEYKDILRKAVQKVCHSKSGEINPVKVGNLVKAYVDKYKHARKHKKEDDSANAPGEQTEPMNISDSP